ncbi:acetylornithine and succinylornithine aminotransferase [Atractiella rhizophila]|nr:acetylornithine and succinylornithine aminotransferase [Atractiella rhizophila]
MKFKLCSRIARNTFVRLILTPPPLSHAQTRHSLPVFARVPLKVSRGKGCTIWDDSGRQYLDCSGGIAVTALGHADEGLTKILADQSSRLVHCSNLFWTEPSLKLTEDLVRLTLQHGGVGFSPSTERSGDTGSASLKAFITNSGTESNEAALKFARIHGKTHSPGKGKEEIVSFENSFHGRTFGSLSVTNQAKYQEPFAPLLPGIKVGKFNDIASLKDLITEKTCGVILEPIQGEGGIEGASLDWLKAVRARCDEVGAVLIYDEIQCGLGRTGKLWAHSSFPTSAHPDIVTSAKALGNGFPIGAVILRDSLASSITTGSHGTTYGGAPLQSAVGSYVLSRISEARFLAHVQEMGSCLEKRLQKMLEWFPELVQGIRGTGLIMGLRMRREGLEKTVMEEMRHRGVIVLTAGRNTVRIVPSLIITKEEIDHLCDVFESVLSTMDKGESN